MLSRSFLNGFGRGLAAPGLLIERCAPGHVRRFDVSVETAWLEVGEALRDAIDREGGHVGKKTNTANAATAAGTEVTTSPQNEATNGLREALDKQIGPLVPQPQRAEIVTRVYTVLQQERFSGPLPHPKHLRDYEDILPGAAERILAMAESTLEHNRSMDLQIVADDRDDRKRGMRYGLSAFFGALVGAGAMGALGQKEVAIAFLAATVIGAVAVFVKGRLGRD